MYPDDPSIDPYDERTWPPDTTCFPDQDYTPVGTVTATATNTATGQSTTSQFTSAGATGDAARFASASGSPSMADLDVAPGQSISVTYDVSVSEPAESTTPIIDQNGNPSTPDEYSVELQSITAPTILWGTSLSPSSLGISASAASCAPADLQNAQGQTLNFTCGLTFSIDSDYTLPDYLKDSGQMIVPQLTTSWEYTFDDPSADLTSTSQYGIATSVFAAISPSPTWLPDAADHSFRVEANKTLTVTPTGLLEGASWSQGSVQGLNTYITNVPSGGTVESNGDLQFTSAQVGNYGFDYYLQDPTSQLRSQDAAGKIQVYSVQTSAAPPPAPVSAPVVSAQPAAVLAHTGSYVPIGRDLVISGALFLAGPALIVTDRIRRRRSVTAIRPEGSQK